MPKTSFGLQTCFFFFVKRVISPSLFLLFSLLFFLFFFSSFEACACTSIVLCTNIQHVPVPQCAVPIFNARTCAPIFSAHNFYTVPQYTVCTTLIPRTNLQCTQILYYAPIFSAHNFYTMHQYSVHNFYTVHQYSMCTQLLYHAPIFSACTTFIPCTNI
jgi:hypothetical protein